jgi:hypothetical protein
MSKMSRHSTTPLEVTVMFEPHRLQHDLLQRAYALLVPLPRRRLTAAQSSPVPARVQAPQGGERSVS